MVDKKQNEIPAETRALKPANGQVLNDIHEALNAVVDLKGEKIDFKRNEDIKDDLVYTGEGSDGKTYTIQLENKTVIVSVYATPKPEAGKKINKSSKDTSNNKKDLDKVVEKLDKPLLDKKDKKE